MRERNIIKKFGIIVFAIILMSMSSFAFTSGSGTQLDPYIVDTCADLQSLNGFTTSYAKLGSNIDCSGYSYADYNFNGHLDGNGYSIVGLNDMLFTTLQSGGEVYNLTMINGSLNLGSTSYVGAIAGQLQGQIRDVGVEGYEIISSGDNIGGMAGRTANTGALIRDSYVINTIIDADEGASDYVGGIVGFIQNADYIYNSYTDLGTTISGHNYVGGFVGRNYGYIYNSYSHSDASGNTYVGGFVGQNYGSSSSVARIYYSYSTGSATGISNVHSFAGHNNAYSSNGQLYECYNDYETSGDNSNYVATSVSTSEMKDIRTFSGVGNWDFKETWLLDNSYNNGYPELRTIYTDYDNSILYQPIGGDGSVSTPYQISTCEVLVDIDGTNLPLDGNYELVNNIDCSQSEMDIIGGTFVGNFEGNNYNISGSYVPLFNTISGSVTNLNVIDAEIYQNIGNNIGIIAQVVGNGGLIENSFTNGIITTTNSYVGGIAGQVQNGGTLRLSKSYADIIAHQSSSSNVGGLVGYNQNGGIIEKSFSHNNLITGYAQIGGFVGRNDGQIYYSYTHSPDIRGTIDVGGFVGYNYGSSSATSRIFGSYSTGIPTGTSNVNSFVGRQNTYSSNGIIYDAYYDSDITGDTSGYGGDVTPLTTEEMGDVRYFSGEYTNYNYWNFDTTWYMNNITGYPALQELDGVDNSIPTMVGDGSVGNPYQITTCRQIWAIPDNSYNNYILMNDIDCSESEMRSPNNFYGVFDGNNNEISYTYVPLFNVIQGNVKNLGITSFHNMLDTTNYVGVLSRQVTGGALVEDVWVSGTIETSRSYVGGITGQVNTGTVRNARSYVDIFGSIATSQNVGGITGYIHNNGYVYTSSSYGIVSGQNQVGGVVGYLYDGWVYDSFSQSDTIEGNSNVGGVVGYSYGSSSSYRAYLYRGYWSGHNLIGSSNVGGVVGYDSGTYAYTYDSYWNQELSGITTSSGGGATGLTTAQMLLQSTYAGTWDFTTTWFMDIDGLGGYPNHLGTSPLIYDEFNVYINYPENNEVIELNDSTDDITFQYLHDSNSTDITCKFYLDGVLYFTTYNTGNNLQSFTLSRWKDKVYYATLSCSDGIYDTSVQHMFDVNLQNDLLTGNPNPNPDGGVAEINITAILDAINSLNITSSGGDTTVIDGGTSVYHNYYTGSQYLNKDALEELNQTSIIIDPRTNETINTSDKYVFDMTPLFNTLTFKNDTLFANLKPKNFYDNVLTQPFVSSEEVGVENGFGAWLLDKVLLNYLVFIIVFGGVTYALSGITLGKTRWERFYKKSFGVAIVGGVILFLINLAIKILVLG